jgi:hypothetical protein
MTKLRLREGLAWHRFFVLSLRTKKDREVPRLRDEGEKNTFRFFLAATLKTKTSDIKIHCLISYLKSF